MLRQLFGNNARIWYISLFDRLIYAQYMRYFLFMISAVVGH